MAQNSIPAMPNPIVRLPVRAQAMTNVVNVAVTRHVAVLIRLLLCVSIAGLVRCRGYSVVVTGAVAGRGPTRSSR